LQFELLIERGLQDSFASNSLECVFYPARDKWISQLPLCGLLEMYCNSNTLIIWVLYPDF
jgi:hypothetical protein